MQKKFIAAILAAALMVLGGTGGMADSRQRIWDMQDSSHVFAEEKSNAAKSAVRDAEGYIGRWSELAEELALEEAEDAYFDMENAYQNDDGLHLEWDEENWLIKNEGDVSISAFGIRIGDAQSDVQKNVEAVRNNYNACSSYIEDDFTIKYQYIMMAVEQDYYLLSITYGGSNKVIEWRFTNVLQGTYVDLKYILHVQEKYGRLEEDSWKSDYIRYISDLSTSDAKYCLIYLNNDTMPELYISETEFDYILTRNSRRIDPLVLRGRGYFIQKRNLFRYYKPAYRNTAKEEIYTIKNGEFKLKASGKIKHNLGKRSYYWNGKKVSQAKYNKLLQKAYPLKKETSLKELKMYHIDQITKQIMQA